jgi:hypothetical protein
LDNLHGEEKNRLYQMLRLEVTPSEEGYKVSGAFCTSGLISLPYGGGKDGRTLEGA